LQSWPLHTETAVRERLGQRVQEGEGSLANLVDLWIPMNLQQKIYFKYNNRAELGYNVMKWTE
jgi:hypothetical protein